MIMREKWPLVHKVPTELTAAHNDQRQLKWAVVRIKGAVTWITFLDAFHNKNQMVLWQRLLIMRWGECGPGSFWR